MTLFALLCGVACIAYVSATDEKEQKEPLNLEDKVPRTPPELEKMQIFYKITCLVNGGKPVPGVTELECQDLKNQVARLQAERDAENAAKPRETDPRTDKEATEEPKKKEKAEL